MNVINFKSFNFIALHESKHNIQFMKKGLWLVFDGKHFNLVLPVNRNLSSTPSKEVLLFYHQVNCTVFNFQFIYIWLF